MAVELLAFALAGCLLGILTGLLPGLHVNSISLIALSIPFLENDYAMVLIASMAIVHTFVDFIPSILLGVPDNDTFLALLPGHRLLLQGKGFLAVKLTIVGGLFAGLASIALGPVFAVFVEKSAEFFSPAIPLVLAVILVAMVLAERGKRKAIALVVVVLSGLLGFLALRGNYPIQQPLFCLATGFFGASTLVDSILKKAKIGKQLETGFFIEKTRVARNSVLALLGGCFVSMMPSIGASQAAFVVRKAVGKIKTSDYLILLGGVNTSTMILSFFVLFAWGKTRTGAAAAIGQISEFGLQELSLVAAACLLAIGFGAIAADLAAKPAVKLLQRFDYRKINFLVLGFVTVLVAAFSGFLGLAFYGIAASIGMLALNSGIKRTNTMAFLMIPTIMHYLAFP